MGRNEEAGTNHGQGTKEGLYFVMWTFWLINPSVIQAQVAELQDALAALESRVKAAEAEKSKLKKENKDLRKADADKEKEMAELVRDLWVIFAQGAFVIWT